MARFRLLWLALELALDGAAFAAAFGLAFALHGHFTPSGSIAALPLLWLALALAAHLALCALLGAYSREKQLLDIGALRGALIATLFGWTGTSTLLWILREPSAHGIASALPLLAQLRAELGAVLQADGVPRVAWSVGYLLLWPLAVLAHRASFALLRSAFRHGCGDVRSALCGSEEDVRRLRRRLQRAPPVGARLVGCFTPSGEPDGGPPRLGSPADLERCVARERIERLWIAGDPRADPTLLDLARAASRASGGRCEVSFALEILPGWRVAHGALGEWLAPVRTAASSRASAALKRAVDLALGVPLAIAALPLLALLALLVRLTSPGPAFVAQLRAGEGGAPFPMWKLRTMRVDAEPGGGTRKLARDPRVTRVGRVLRRFSLDELPQLWNVLRGDMSLVGPRPEVWAVAAGYDERLRERLRAKPGLTGLWQVSPARHRPIHEELDYDLCYVRRRGFWLDLTILLLTPAAVLWGSGAR